jgi:NhaP-type Na+/H+ or K+/H+ antiporter
VLFIARTAVLMPALIGTRLDLPERLFMSWFGPRGVACITYALLVLSLGVPGGEEIFHLAALVVFGSIILHGASDTPLANWFGRRHTTVK